MKRIVSISVAMMLSAAAWGQQSDQQQAIINKAKEIDQALIKGDQQAFNQLTPQDWQGIQPNGTIETRDQIASRIFTNKKMQISKVDRLKDNVRIYGNTAVENALLDIAGTENGQPFENKYSATNVWLNQNGNWVPVSSQMTVFQPQASVAMAGAGGAAAQPAAAQETNLSQQYQQLVQNDLQQLGGRWQLQRAVVNGKEAPQSEVQNTVLVTQGNNFNFPQSSKVGTAPSGTFTINPLTDPKQVDTVAGAGPNQGKVSLGIYKIEGDTHTFAFSSPGRPRPTQFESPSGSHVTLQVWKRAGQ